MRGAKKGQITDAAAARAGMTDKQTFEEILGELAKAHFTDDRLAQFGHLISARQYLGLYRLASKYVRTGAKVLDWGAGNGHFSWFLVRSGYRVKGCDFEGPPPVCGSFIPDEYEFRTFAPEDPVSIPFESEAFDAVAGIGVLEHVRESGGTEAGSLSEIRRVLKPGGVFICYHLPNRYSWIEAALRLARRWTHPYAYTSGDIASFLKDSGFDVVEIRRYAILPRNIWSWGISGMTNMNVRIARAYDTLDDIFSKVAPFICQNYLFVARKQAPQQTARWKPA